MMKKYNPVMIGLFVIFLIVNILDLITSKHILFAEANPIYVLFSKYWVLIFIKLIFIIPIGLIIFMNKYSGHVLNFFIISFLIFNTIMIIIAVILNASANYKINQLSNEDKQQVINELSNVSNKEKISQYFLMVSILYFAPLILSMISFILYRWNLKYSKIDKKYNKIKYWWRD